MLELGLNWSNYTPNLVILINVSHTHSWTNYCNLLIRPRSHVYLYSGMMSGPLNHLDWEWDKIVPLKLLDSLKKNISNHLPKKWGVGTWTFPLVKLPTLGLSLGCSLRVMGLSLRSGSQLSEVCIGLSPSAPPLCSISLK